MSHKLSLIRNRLLLAFLLFTAIILFLATASYISLNQIKKAAQLNQQISHLKSESLVLLQRDLQFLNILTSKVEFYESGTTPYLDERSKTNQHIQEKYRQAIAQTNKLNQPLTPELSASAKYLRSYNTVFSNILNKQLKRGYRDYGLEGEMRYYAHQLEDFEEEIDLAAVLKLRRHEKDYILRQDSAYCIKLSAVCSELKQSIISRETTPKRKQILALLTSYENSFNHLVMMQNEIGLRNGTGLYAQLNEHSDSAISAFIGASEKSKQTTGAYIQNVLVTYILLSLFCLLLAVFLSYQIAKSFSRPIQKLSEVMKGFLLAKQLNSKTSSDLAQHSPTEIKELTDSYFRMTRQINAQYEEIHEKNKTLKEQNHQLTKLNEELDKFAYSTSHDLRAPLTSLLGLVELAKLEDNHPSTTECLTLMEQSIHKMDGFILDILSYSKNKSVDLDIQQINLVALVTELFNKNRSYSLVQGVTLDIDIQDEVALFTDASRLQLLLGNLISNAVRYSDANKSFRFLSISGVVSSTQVHLTIEDNGIGIDNKFQSRVFEMFFRASKKSQGSGLGLYIVKEATEKLGGSIILSSLLGVGTSFELIIPNHFISNPRVDSTARVNHSNKRMQLQD